MHLQQAPASDVIVDAFAPLAALPAGEVGCLKGDEGSKIVQDGCIQDVGRVCLPKDFDETTGEIGAPTKYRRGTTLVASPTGITCAVKW